MLRKRKSVTKQSFIISVDQSTAGTKAIVIDRNGKVVYKCSKTHRQILPKPGWVEHDPGEIYHNVWEILNRCIKESEIGKAAQVAAIALTNQRETVVVWDKKTGEPVYHAIVWQCNRAKNICERLRKENAEEYIQKTSGLRLSEYFSAAKAAWILENAEIEEGTRSRLKIGTVDSWLIWNLTGKKRHVTDYSNASRMQLLNLDTLRWDEELLRMFGLEASMMPELICSNECAGYTCIDGVEIPLIGMLGDSHAALFAQVAFQQEVAKATYGTGSSVMVNVGNHKIAAKDLSRSIAWGYSGKISYALEGNINSSGATVKWICENMKLAADVREAEQMAQKITGTNGVYLVPAFVGMNSPYWNGDAKALLYGMTFETEPKHIVRAALEAIAYQIRDIVDCMKTQGDIEVRELRVDGQATENRFLMQFQSDILQIPVRRNQINEASAYGAALMAGLGAELWGGDEIVKKISSSERYEPHMGEIESDSLYRGWKNAVWRSLEKNKF